MPVIKSLLDNDWYKILMGQVAFNQFPRAKVRYRFINRRKDGFPKGLSNLLWEEIHSMSGLSLSSDEYTFLSAQPELKRSYLEWLRHYKYDPGEVSIRQEGPNLNLTIEGPWYRTIFWEVPILATISELYFSTARVDKDWEDRIKFKYSEFARLGIFWADFGTRRRYHYDTQDAVVRLSPAMAGTSNVHFAHKYNRRPVGTYAHEAPMVMQARYGYRHCNIAWLEALTREYEGRGFLLPDTVTTPYFLNHLPYHYAKVYAGMRQDSGDPIQMGSLIVQKYRDLDIDPREKTIVFSDNINSIEKVQLYNDYFNKWIRTFFGIGTWLTADIGPKPLNMVIKPTHADLGYGMVPVVKLSDEPGKHTGDKESIQDAIRQCNV